MAFTQTRSKKHRMCRRSRSSSEVQFTQPLIIVRAISFSNWSQAASSLTTTVSLNHHLRSTFVLSRRRRNSATISKLIFPNQASRICLSFLALVRRSSSPNTAPSHDPTYCPNRLRMVPDIPCKSPPSKNHNPPSSPCPLDPLSTPSRLVPGL